MPIIKLGDRATTSLIILTSIGVFVIAARVLIWTDKFHTGLLYIAVPFGLSVALYYLTPDTDGTTWKRRFWNNLRHSMIVMFAASLLLMEGYVCVVVFIPIFVFFAIVAFLNSYLRSRDRNGRVNVYVVPAIVMLLSLEGTSEVTTFNRYNEVSYSQVIQTDVERIKERLTQPINLRGDRHWVLSVFPMPRHIGTVRLNAGEVRKYDFVYHRWFVTNSHAGSVDVTFTEVGVDRIKTTINDNSYISNYMKLRGTEFAFDPLGEARTKVTLTIKFERLLDPVWYFEPLQRFAVRKGAEYFINQILGDGTWDAKPFPKGEIRDV